MVSVALLELLDAPGGVDQLLLPGKEGMTGRADLDLHLRHDGTQFDFIATGTYGFNLIVFRVNTFFHSYYSSNTHLEAVS